MDFYNVLNTDKDYSHTPYANKQDGKWIEGDISVIFLNKHFSQYETAQEMINATNSEGLKLYFAWLSISIFN